MRIFALALPFALALLPGQAQQPAPEAPKSAEKTDTAQETNWILKIGQAVTVLGAVIGVVVSVWGLRDKAENEKIAADFNLKSELAKETIAEKQLQIQEEEYRRQHAEHIADAERKRISDENESLSTLLTDLFKSDSGSEGVLATLTSYADGTDAHADALAEAI